MAASSWPMLWNAVPIFSSVSHSMAVFTGVAPALPSQFAGIAIQNPNLSPVQVTASLVSSDNVTLASATLSIPPGSRMMREISELTGRAPFPGSSVVVTADQPVQVFGYIADRLTGSFTPFAAAVANP
jgi:hypothetical protein